MPRRSRPLLGCLLALASATPGLAIAQDTRPDSAVVRRAVPGPRPLNAVAQALLVNVVVNRFDAWALGAFWAKVSPSSWGDNLSAGWEWDENQFTTNMFSHPYHGGLYFNAGRANGLDYWESAPIAFLGSWTWEYLGETHRPSLNDFFMTSFGGIALGEMFHRVATGIRDNRARGTGRLLREIAALPVDPVGSLNRLVRGQWGAIDANPPEHDPGAFALRVSGGARWTGEADADSVDTSPTVLFDLEYGDPFRQPYTAPFDVFRVRAQFGSGIFHVLRASGRLYGRDLNGSRRRHRHLFMVNQRYDYVRNPSQQFGAQSVDVGLYSSWRLGERTAIRTQFAWDGIILGAIDAPSSGVGERTYDFGPGLGGRIEIELVRDGIPVASLLARTEYLHSISGAEANHFANFGGLEATIPVIRGVDVGLAAGFYSRHSMYANGLDERRSFPEIRVTLGWSAADRAGRAGLP